MSDFFGLKDRPNDDCEFCGTSKAVSKHSNYKGCVSCKAFPFSDTPLWRLTDEEKELAQKRELENSAFKTARTAEVNRLFEEKFRREILPQILESRRKRRAL